MSLVWKFFSHVVPGVLKPLRVLWNEMIGFVFIVLALWSIPAAWSAYRNLHADPANLGRLILATLFSLMMLGFGAYSFLRARKIGKS